MFNSTCPKGLLAILLAWPATASALPRTDLPRAENMWEGLRGEPGSGAAREPTGSSDPSRLAAPRPLQAKDPEDAAGVAALEQIVARYRNAARISAHTLA